LGGLTKSLFGGGNYKVLKLDQILYGS
jgi:hypothetical protein